MGDNSVRLLIGHAGPEEAKIWVRGDRQRRAATVQLYSRGELQQSREVLVVQEPHTGVAHFQGLTPNQEYLCKLSWNSGSEEESGRFRTAPQEARTFSFLLGSCNYPTVWGLANQPKAWRHIHKIIEARKPDFMLHCGDQIYADPWPAKLRKLTLENYRKSYLKAWSGPARSVLSSLPHYMILDDHEVRNNYSGDERESDHWARQTYEDFQHSHNPHTFGALRPYYYTFDWGDAHFFVLDTRTERKVGSQIISKQQMTHLKEWLKALALEHPKFVVTGVPLVGCLKFGAKDKWTGFPEQREELLRFLTNESLHNVFFLTGDMHHSYCSSMVLKNERGSTLVREVMASPINQALDYGTGWFYKQGTRHLSDGTTSTTRIDEMHRVRDNVILLTVDLEKAQVRGEIYHTKKNDPPHPPFEMNLTTEH